MSSVIFANLFSRSTNPSALSKFMNIQGKVEDIRIHRYLLVLMVVSAVMRALIAGLFELGNDEVYYWTYALYPDLSHFDHPPMVGWLIRLFTFNLHFDIEFFLRLASVVGGTLNTWLVFQIGKKLKDTLTGWYAALLYTASIYSFVITGIFILPDTPQSIFWLLALWLMLDCVEEMQAGKRGQWLMILIGILLGLGLLSKYTTAFLWAGFVITLLANRRIWFRKGSFYIMNLLMIAIFSIVIIWNLKNQFASFSYQGGRGLVNEAVFNMDILLTEILGEIVYHNPISFLWIVLALVWVFRNKAFLAEPKTRLVIFTGLPIIIVFLILSMFRSTLPHWSGPGYMTLIILAALWIRNGMTSNVVAFPGKIITSLTAMLLIVTVSMVQIRTGFIRLEDPEKTVKKNRIADYSLELFGWRQLGEKFKALAEHYESVGSIDRQAPLVSYRWFPAAHLEYYVARPSERVVLASGDLGAIHKYAWINREHGGFQLNTDAWYITSSRDFRDPALLRPLYYEIILPPDTIDILRNGRTAYQFYVYRMINLQAKPVDVLK